MLLTFPLEYFKRCQIFSSIKQQAIVADMVTHRVQMMWKVPRAPAVMPRLEQRTTKSSIDQKNYIEVVIYTVMPVSKKQSDETTSMPTVSSYWQHQSPEFKLLKLDKCIAFCLLRKSSTCPWLTIWFYSARLQSPLEVAETLFPSKSVAQNEFKRLNPEIEHRTKGFSRHGWWWWWTIM